MSGSATDYNEPATAVSSFMRPFIHEGRYACYDNAACDVDDDDESPLDSLSTIRGDDDDDERLLSVDGYEGDGDSDEYGCGERDDDDDDDDDDSDAEYATYGSDFSVEELHEFMLQQQQQSMLDYAYSLRRYSLLETIREETNEELRGDAASEQSDSCSGVWCWGDDFTDGAESVIYVEETINDGDASDRNTEAESSDSTGSVISVEMAPLSVLGPRRQSPGGPLDDPSEREGSWLDAEAEPAIRVTNGQGEVHPANGWDSSCVRSACPTLGGSKLTVVDKIDEGLSTEVSYALAPSSPRLAPIDLKAMDSAAVLSYLKSVLVNGDASGRALLQRHLDKTQSGDSDLLILFDNEEKPTTSAVETASPPRDSDAADSESPPDSEFPSWSDAIDAYLMSLAVDQATTMPPTAVPLWRPQGVGSDSTATPDVQTPKSCFGSAIPGHDLPKRATAPPHRSTESPPSCFRDGSPADFDGVEALERTAGDGAEEATPAASCHEAAATIGRRHRAASLRLSGVKSAPDLLLDDGDASEDLRGVAFYDDGEGKTQSVPCIASSSGDEEEDGGGATFASSGGVAEGGFRASKAFFGLGMSNLACCPLDRGRLSQSLDSQLSRSFAGSSSGCASEEEEEEDEEDEERAGFPRFTPPGALRSFRSFDTLHLAGQREEAALRRSCGSWMDGIEECSEREEKARPSSDNLSEDSGYCDAGLRPRSKMALLAEVVDDDGKAAVDVFSVRDEQRVSGEVNEVEEGEIRSESSKRTVALEDPLRIDRVLADQQALGQAWANSNLEYGTETSPKMAPLNSNLEYGTETSPKMAPLNSNLEYGTETSPKMAPLGTNLFRVEIDQQSTDQDRESKPGLCAILETENGPEKGTKMEPDLGGEDLFHGVRTDEELVEIDSVACCNTVEDSEDRLRRLLLSDSKRRHRGHSLCLQGANAFGHSDEIGSSSVCALNEVTLATHDDPVDENGLGTGEEEVDLGGLPCYEHFENFTQNADSDAPIARTCSNDTVDQRQCTDTPVMSRHNHQQHTFETRETGTETMGAPKDNEVNQQESAEGGRDERHQKQEQNCPVRDYDDAVAPPEVNSPDVNAQCGIDQVEISCLDGGHQPRRTPSPLTLGENQAEACGSGGRDAEGSSGMSPPLVSHFGKGAATLLGPEASHSSRIPGESDVTSVNLGRPSAPAGSTGVAPTLDACSLINQTDDFIIRGNPESGCAVAESALKVVSDDRGMDNVLDSAVVDEVRTIANDSTRGCSELAANEQPKVTTIYAIITLVRRTSSPAIVDDSKVQRADDSTNGHEREFKTAPAFVQLDEPSNDSALVGEVNPTNDSVCRSRATVSDEDRSEATENPPTAILDARVTNDSPRRTDSTNSPQSSISLRASPQTRDCALTLVDKSSSGVDDPGEIRTSVEVEPTPIVGGIWTPPPKTAEASGAAWDRLLADRSTSAIVDSRPSSEEDRPSSAEKQPPNRNSGEKKRPKEGGEREERRGEECSYENQKEDGEGVLSRSALNRSAFTPAQPHTDARRPTAVGPRAVAGKSWRKALKVGFPSAQDGSNRGEEALNLRQDSIDRSPAIRDEEKSRKLSDRKGESSVTTTTGGAKRRGKKDDAAMSRAKQPSKIKRNLWWPLKLGRSSGRSVQATPASPMQPDGKPVEVPSPDDAWDPDWIGTSIDVELDDDRLAPTCDGMPGPRGVAPTRDGLERRPYVPGTSDEGPVIRAKDRKYHDDEGGVSIHDYPTNGSETSTGDFWGPLPPSPDERGTTTAVLISSERAFSSKSNGSATTPGKPPLPPTHRQQHIHHQRAQAAPCRAKIINARQHFIVKGGPPRASPGDSDSDDASAPRADVHEALEQFRQRALEGKERVAKTVLDLSQRIQERCSSSDSSDALDVIDPRRRGQSEVESGSHRGGLDTAAIALGAVDDERSDGDQNDQDFSCEKGFRDAAIDEEAAIAPRNLVGGLQQRDVDGSSSASSASSPPIHGARSSFRRLSAAASYSWRDSTQSIGYLETDIDTLHSREVIRVPDKDATAAVPSSPALFHGAGSARRHRPFKLKTRSMFNLTAADEGVAAVAAAAPEQQQQQRHHRLDCGGDEDMASRAKSMEFLLKDENKLSVLPPENQLRQTHGDAAQRLPSEHELRVRRSLQKLDLPEWYTSSPISRMGSTEGFILRKDQATVPRWTDFRSRSSCNVDGSQPKTPVSSTKSVVISKRVTTPDLRYVKSSRESLLQSPMSPSPSSKDASSGYFYYTGGAMSRWSSSRLSCATTASSRSTSPTGSLRLPFQRQPYLGWRSSERLAREATNCSTASSASSTPTHGGGPASFYRSAAERLSQGPGYYALRYGVYRAPGSETNLASPSQGASRRSSNTSADAATVAPLPPRYSPPDNNNHAGITVNVIEPNGYSDSGATAAMETGDDSGQMLVADLVREIDKLIHRNGHSDDHLAEVKEDDGRFKMEAVQEETKSDLGNVTDRQQKFVWMESSFVGVRPIAKPESPPNAYPAVTPLYEDNGAGKRAAEKITSQAQVHPPPPALFQTPSLFRQESTDRRLSLNSTTLEEVLDSLLALPSSSQSPSPSGYRPSKWETLEIESMVQVQPCQEEEITLCTEDIDAVAPETSAAVSEESLPMTVAVEHSVPNPVGYSAEGSSRPSSSGSNVGSTGSSTASFSGNSRADGEDDGNDRASGSSGSDLTTATTTVASGSSSYRLSGTTSTGDSPSASGNSHSSSLSASTSASGSGKEVIPPPPDFTDRPSERSQQSVPSPSIGHERSETLLQEPSEAQPVITSNTRVDVTAGHASTSDFATTPHHTGPQSPSPIQIGHQSPDGPIATAVHVNASEQPPEIHAIITRETSAVATADHADISDFATSSHYSVPPSTPPQHLSAIGQPPTETHPIASSKKYAHAAHASPSKDPDNYQPCNKSLASEEFSASSPMVLCFTATSGIDEVAENLSEEEEDADQALQEPRRSESFPPPPTPEQFRELQQLHQSQQQSFDSDVALPLSDSFSSSLGIPSSMQSSLSCEPVLDAGECRFRVDSKSSDGARQESFDEMLGEDDCRSMDAITLLEPDATLQENHSGAVDVSLANILQDTRFEEESVTSESTTAQLRSLDTTREEDIMAPHRRSVQLDDTVIVRCSHVQCKKTAELRDARKTFKTCHNCYTYYCSRECRKDHWMRHRRVCMYGRIRSMCKQAIQCCREGANVLFLLSKLARTGYMTQGRGFVKIVFRNTDLAIRFLRQGWSQLEDGPMYVNWRDLIPQEMGDEVYRAVVDLCQRYEPETKFVLLVAIFITREVPVQSVPHWEREVIAKCAKLSLSKFVGKDGHGLLNEDPNTLILTGPQQTKGADVNAARKAREICLLNIQEQLRERGVSLRHQFPDAYGRLCSYVDNDDPFPPLTIYPKDGRTGNTFMCVIMPNAGPQLNDWLKSRVK